MKRYKRILLIILSLILLLTPISIVVWEIIVFKSIKPSISDFKKLMVSGLGLKDVVVFCNDTIGAKKTLVMRQGDFLNYTDLNIVHIYDNQVVRLANSRTKESAYQALIELGFEYLMFNSYDNPVVFATGLQEVIRDPYMTSIEFQQGGYTIYKLILDKHETGTYWEGSAEVPVQLSYVSKDLLFSVGVKYSSFGIHDDYPPSRAAQNFPDMKGVHEILFQSTVFAHEDTKLTLSLLMYSPNGVRQPELKRYFLKKGKNIIEERFLKNFDAEFKLTFHTNYEHKVVFQDSKFLYHNLKEKEQKLRLYFSNYYLLPEHNKIYTAKVFAQTYILLSYFEQYRSDYDQLLKVNVRGKGVFCITREGSWRNIFLPSNCFLLQNEKREILLDVGEKLKEAYHQFSPYITNIEKNVSSAPIELSLEPLRGDEDAYIQISDVEEIAIPLNKKP